MVQFSIPYFRDLNTHRAWNRSSRHEYSVVRFHFASVADGLRHRLEVGPPVGEITVPLGVTEDIEYERTVEVQKVDEQRAVREWIVESQTFSELAGQFSAGAAAGGFKLDAGLSSTLRAQFSNSLRIETGRTRSSTVKRAETVKLKVHVDGQVVAGAPTYIASNYRERCETLFLAFVDVLAIRYNKKHLLSPRRRIKVPAFDDRWQGLAVDARPNVAGPLNWPICGIRYWEYVQHSHPVYLKSNYPEQLIDFGCIEVIEPVRGTPDRLPFDGPSLYHLSNTAFPRRWSEFKQRLKESDDDPAPDDDN